MHRSCYENKRAAVPGVTARSSAERAGGPVSVGGQRAGCGLGCRCPLGREECVLSTAMLYHKAIQITRPEADFIIRHPTSSLNECVVVECFELWYDVRRMTESELAAFLETLHRAHLADIAAGSITPH
jgi:hypothetical protein